MQERNIHKVFTIFMALLVLLSTVSITIGKHFCGDKLMHVSMFVPTDPCGMTIDTDKAVVSVQKNCCNDEIEVVQGQDKLKVTNFEDLHFDQQVFLASLVTSYAQLFEGLPEQKSPHKNYNSPNLITDIQVLDQVFLI